MTLRETIQRDLAANPSILVRAFLVNYRIARWVFLGSLPVPVKRFARLIHLVLNNVLILPLGGGELHPTCAVGGGLRFAHRLNGVIVHPGAVLGDDVTLYPGVVIGARWDDQDRVSSPVIGDRVIIFPGAKILGGVTVGADAVVGANAVVIRDVPSQGRALATPATITG